MQLAKHIVADQIAAQSGKTMGMSEFLLLHFCVWKLDVLPVNIWYQHLSVLLLHRKMISIAIKKMRGRIHTPT